MLGTLSFLVVMTTFCVMAIWWLNGNTPDRVQKNTPVTGRTVHLSLWKWRSSVVINQDLWIRLTFLVLGPSAVTGLSISYAQVLPLRVVFVLFVLPAHLVMIILGLRFPKWGKRAAVGFVAGVLATIFYDAVRLLVTYSLDLPDPIPHIGVLWLGPETIAEGDLWWVGYLWRFFGNGAGLGIAYAMLPKFMFNLKGGWIYGDVVGLGMFAVLFFFPVAQFHLFILNSIVLVNGILGHWAYGLAMGYIFMKSKIVQQFDDSIYVKQRKPLTWQKP